MSFAEGAGRLAGLAGALLGWRPGEFWAATPAELATVLAAMGGEEAGAASSDDLARLMRLHPDEEEDPHPNPLPRKREREL